MKNIFSENNFYRNEELKYIYFLYFNFEIKMNNN